MLSDTSHAIIRFSSQMTLIGISRKQPPNLGIWGDCLSKRMLTIQSNIKRSHKLNVLHKYLLSNTGFPRRHNSSISPGRNISIRYILNDRYVTVHQSHSFNIPHLPHALVTTSPRALQRRYWALAMGRWGLKSCENIGEMQLDIRQLQLGVGLNSIVGLF